MATQKIYTVRMIVIAIISASLTVMLFTTIPLLSRVLPFSPQSFSSHLSRLFPSLSKNSDGGSGFSWNRSNLPTSFLRKLSNKKCDYPIVYHKPPKTASSFIQTAISNWSAEQGRNNYKCSQRPVETNLILEECIPSNVVDECGILNCHIFLNQNSKRILNERLPNHKLLTSTRYPPYRIISFFLHTRRVRINDTLINDSGFQNELVAYLETFNPWRLYNYHTGENASGSCPLTYGEKIKISSLASQYHLVIDANLRNTSNAILKSQNLFQLPAVVAGERNKDRGAYKFMLPSNIKDLLFKVSCVEITLHNALQVRMASLYQQATGIPCLFGNGNCIQEMEREQLKTNWIF